MHQPLGQITHTCPFDGERWQGDGDCPKINEHPTIPAAVVAMEGAAQRPKAVVETPLAKMRREREEAESLLRRARSLLVRAEHLIYDSTMSELKKDYGSFAYDYVRSSFCPKPYNEEYD